MLPSRPRLLLLLTLVFALFGATVAIAQPDPRVEARAHYQAGVAKYNAAQYDEAVAEFRAAEQLAPSPMNDYNIGLALDRKGDAAGAIAAYRAYLDRSPNAANRADVEGAIAKLKPAADAASAAAAEAARQAAAQAAADEAARRAAEQAAAASQPIPQPPAATGDPDLDRVAMVDLNAMRAQPLPAPSGGGTPAPTPDGSSATAPGPTGDAPKKSSRPFYKSPVFWVLAAVGVYVLIVLADDSSNNSAQTGRMLPLPEGAPRMSSGPTVFSF